MRRRPAYLVRPILALLGPSESFSIHVDQPSGTVHVIVDVVGCFQ